MAHFLYALTYQILTDFTYKGARKYRLWPCLCRGTTSIRRQLTTSILGAMELRVSSVDKLNVISSSLEFITSVRA